ncbi:MAG TPA: hypothetical protein VES67_06040 [Vicinamibacterales bacterium]|nr:hypothetical protein [Vicinamibacterales bacterium]
MAWSFEQKAAGDAELLEARREYRRGRRAWLKAVRGRRAIAVNLIADGYRQQARKAHPDVGGSVEAMLRLNTIRDALLESVTQIWDSRLMGMDFSVTFTGEADAPPRRKRARVLHHKKGRA